MRMFVFAKRCLKEIIRDPLNIAFGLGFPIVLLLLLTAIQSNIPVEMFVLNQLTPGIAVFGLSFITLFSATLISKDRSSSFLTRMLTSPLSSSDFILGYALPMLPVAVLQVIICFVVSFCLGLEVTVNVLLSIIVIIPTAIMFISIGLLAGSVFNDKQVGGICGALLTNLSAWLSGTWFDLELVGGAFKKIAYVLPFANAVDASRAALNGNFSDMTKPLLIVCAYAVAVTVAAILVFHKKMTSDKA